VDKNKRKLEKRLKKFRERQNISKYRQKLIPITINKCHRSLVYLELLNKTIKTIDYSDKMLEMSQEIKNEPLHKAADNEKYEEYRELLSEEIWKNKEISSKFPNYFYYTYIQSHHICISIETRACEVFSGTKGLLYKSPEGINVQFEDKKYKLYWSTHAVNRIIERITKSTYQSFNSAAYIIYFLNWFKIITIKGRNYLLIYLLMNDNKCHLLGIAPFDIDNDKMIVKTFLHNDYIKHLNLDKIIEKPNEYNMKAHVLSGDYGYMVPLNPKDKFK
jgi:hypothetical protein